MKCNLCEAEVTGGTISSYAGFVCEDDGCKNEARTLRESVMGKARAYSFDDIPETMDVPAFEDFVLGYAVSVLDNEDSRKVIREINPLLVIPEELALFWKDRLLEGLRDELDASNEFLDINESRGHERWFHGGTFRFIKPIPSEAVLEVAKRLGMMETNDD